MTTITGNKTDETFIALNGVSYNGQGGVDTLVFSGSYASYDIELKNTGNIKTDVSWSGGSLDTKWIERFVFSDGVYNVTTDTFTANPPPATPTLSIADAAVNEEAGTITFTVTLSAPAVTPVTFNYSTADGTAGSADYVGVTNQIGTIGAGQTSTTITIALINDNTVESGGETFFVNLSNPVGATIADGQAVGTILEQDQLIVGTAGNDDGVSNPTLVGGNGDDTIQGLGGDDGLVGGLGNDALIGGAGFDRAIYTNATTGISVALAAGTVTVGTSTDTLQGIELVRGSGFADSYSAVGFGPTGNPNNSTEGNNFNAFEGLAGDDQVTGNGNTRIEYTNATAGVTVDLSAPALGAPVGATGFATGDASVGNDTIFGGVTRVRGSEFADTITGGGANEILEGRGGNDTINGGGGIDIALFNGVRGNYTITPGGVPGSSTVTDNVGGEGTDTLTNVELTEFSDAYNLNQRVLNLNGFGLAGGKQVFGTNLTNAGVGDNLTMGLNANGRFIDLVDGGTDTLTLAVAGNYNLNLARVEIIAGSGGADVVTLQNAASGMTVNLGTGSDSLNLSSASDTVTVTNVETVFSGGGVDSVTFLHNDASAGQTFNLAGGDDTLILAGSDSNYSLTLFGNMTVVGASDSGNEVVNVVNNQLGTTFDLGAGIDTLTLNSSAFPNSVTVQNVENVTAVGSMPDTIVIAGNSGGTTTVTAGGGGDQITASADQDHMRFITPGDLPFDLPGAGQRDIVTGFDADEDKFVFDDGAGTAFSGSVGWAQTNFAGNEIILVDIDGGGTLDANNDSVEGDYAGWEMAIGVVGLTGTLDNSDFLVI